MIMSLPMRLDVMVDNISAGAIIRHQTDDYNAVALDYTTLDDRKGEYLIVAYLDDGDADESYELTPDCYKIMAIPLEDFSNWMVMTMGTDFILGTGE